MQLNARFFYFVQCSTLKALKGARDKETNPLVNQGQNLKSRYQMRGKRSVIIAMETKLHKILEILRRNLGWEKEKYRFVVGLLQQFTVCKYSQTA